MHRKPHVHRGVVLIAAIFTVALVAIYLSITMTRTLVESQAATRYGDMIRALHAAEAGLDGLLQVLNDRNCGDGACVSTMQVQRDILQWVYNGGQGAYPSGAPPFLSSPSH